MYIYSPIFFTLFLSVSANIQCPTDNIISDGVWPPGAIDMVQLPNDYVCVQSFIIPVGFVVKLTVITDYPNILKPDTFSIINSAGDTINFPPGTTTLFLPASVARLFIVTKTDKSKAFIKYQFIDMRRYRNIPMKTGEYMKFDPQSLPESYTFTSQVGDKITITPEPEDVNDKSNDDIYVYDGDSVSAPYLGTLATMVNTTIASTGKSITLVNFYNTPSTFWVIANDKSKIDNFLKYRLLLSGSGYATTGHFVNYLDQFTAFTIICKDCEENHIIDFEFFGSSKMVQFAPMSPTHNLAPLLTYKPENDLALPQKLQTKMFTMLVQNSDFQITVSPIYEDWVKPYPGRMIQIFSPSLWDPSKPGSFFYKFESSTVYNYSIQANQVTIKDNGRLHMEIDNQSGSLVDEGNISCDSDRPPCTKTNIPEVVGKGQMASVSYNGASVQSNSWTTMKVTGVGGAPTTTTPTTISTISTTSVPTRITTTSFETTTKSGTRIAYFVVFMISIFVKFL